MENLDLLQIHKTWTDLREARVKDSFIFRVSRYFIDHWLRTLGAKTAWAVVDLQQRCYLENADFCQVSLKQLCDATGVRSTTTMQRIVDEPMMRWFFAKQNTRGRRNGRVVRGKNRYNLQMSDPLTPTHQGQIARLLEERLRESNASEVLGPEDLIRLVSDLPPLSSLPTDDLPAWATEEPLNLRQLALRALSRAGIGSRQVKLDDEAALRRAFSEAQASITQPTRIALATHYFRTDWVPHLGATNAWLITILRSRCYWNKESGEVRDVCVMSNRELADLLGVSTRTVSRGLQDPLVRKFVTPQERVYERRDGDGRKTPSRTRFQVRLTMDPLTPPDEETFAQILRSNAARYGLDPATGQMDMLDILDMMSQMTGDEISQRCAQWGDKVEIRKPSSEDTDRRSTDKNGNRVTVPTKQKASDPKQSDKNEVRTSENPPPEAKSGDKNEIRGDSRAKNEIRSPHSSDKFETIAPHSTDKFEKQYLNTTINTSGKGGGEREQQQYPVAVDSLHQLLSEYGIEEPALSQITANDQVTPKLAQAWMLYADNQPELKRKAAYVVKRLNRSPPDTPSDPELLLAAGLGENERAGFAHRWALESYGASVSFESEGQEAKYKAWLRFYGDERGAVRGNETTVESDRRRASRWQPDVG